MLRSLILFLLLIPVSVSLRAQEVIIGSVYSAKDSSVIAGASIYFDGTSFGVSSNSEGKFAIKYNEGISAPLVISSLGFQTLAIKDYRTFTGKSLKIYLLESTEALGEVFLETDPWSRKKKLNIFKREFLGNTPETRECKIRNEDAIKLIYVPSRDILLAYAEEPILITNRFLGYEVSYNLENFKVEFRTVESGLHLPHLVYYDGYSYFRELKENPGKKIMANRANAYKGSSLHFMRALANEKLHENGFRIFYDKFEIPPYQYIKIQPKGQTTLVDVLREEISILYNNFDQSMLTTNGIFEIDQWGNHYPATQVIFGGEMSHSRISRTLPLNFQPE